MKPYPIPAVEPTSASATLRDAISMEFDSVIVFGIKDGRIFIHTSHIEDNLRMIGALEAAKQQVWNNA